MSYNFKELVSTELYKEPRVISPGMRPIKRVLLCPDGLDAVVQNRSDGRSPGETKDAFAHLTAQLLYLGATGIILPHSVISVPGVFGRVGDRAASLSSKDTGEPYLWSGEATLWQLKAAGYHITGPEDFVAHEIPQQLFFKFSSGKLVNESAQLSALYLLRKAAYSGKAEGKVAVGDRSQEQVIHLLNMIKNQRKAAAGYSWEVVTGKHETNADLSVVMLAFGEVCPSEREQKETIQQLRMRQLPLYLNASEIELIRAGLPKPERSTVGVMREILFANETVKSPLGILPVIEEAQNDLGFTITPHNLVDAVTWAYQVVWSSALSTAGSVRGRFNPSFN